jgi:hypothetical protein
MLSAVSILMTANIIHMQKLTEAVRDNSAAMKTLTEAALGDSVAMKLMVFVCHLSMHSMP